MKALDSIFKYDVLGSARITLIKNFPNLKNREFEVRLLKQGCPECIKGTVGWNVCHLVNLYQVRLAGENEWRTPQMKPNTCLHCENRIMEIEAGKEYRRHEIRKKTAPFWVIPDELQPATLANFVPSDPATSKALFVANDYIAHWKANDRYNLYFRGSYGAGKSHLLKAIADEIRHMTKPDGEPYLVGFIPMESVLTLIKSTWKGGENQDKTDENKIIQGLIDLDFLVLDDVGSEGGEWAGKKLFEIINGRMGKPTAITTNFMDWTKFEERFAENGGKIVSRLRRNAKIVDIETSDKRITER